MPQIRPIKDLRNTTEISELYQKLSIAENQIKNGELLDAEKVFKGLRKKHENK